MPTRDRGRSKRKVAMPTKHGKTEPTTPDYRQSAINLPKTDWRLLRRVAEARTDKAGSGRPSVSAVIQSLIDANRKALETEARSAMQW